MVRSVKVPMSEFVMQAVGGSSHQPSHGSAGAGIPVNLSGRARKNRKSGAFWCILVHL